jgi:diacylglycerol kinase (ATP)
LLLNEAAGTAFKLQDVVWRSIAERAEVVEMDGDVWRDRAAAAARHGRRLIAAGGDGTIHTVANLLLQAAPGSEVAIIPAGTGNDLARGLGLPIDDLEQAVDLALSGRAQPVDAIEFSGNNNDSSYFLNVGYGGFGERVADQVAPESKERWGLLPHWIQLAKQMLDLPCHEVAIRTPTGEATLTLHGLLIANACYLGRGVPAAPQARMDDGLMDVILVPAQSLWDRFLTSVELLRGQADESERTLSFATSELTVQASPELNYTFDGEAAPDGPLHFRVHAGALRIVAAEGAPALVPPAPT